MTQRNSQPVTMARSGASVAVRFVAAMSAWTIAFLALIRLPWIEGGMVQSLIQFQRLLAEWYGATPTSAVLVNTSCSGADQMALCLGVTLAYPLAWPRRLIGAIGGLIVVLILNTIRIGTLLTSVTSPRLFEALHAYIWPVTLMAAVALYVLAWIRWNDGGRTRLSPALARFGGLAALFLFAHAALAPWTFSSPLVFKAGAWTARVGDVLLAFGGTVRSQGNMLVTSRGAFLVTQECLLTPLLPLYLAAALAFPRRLSRRVLALVVAVPLFFALGVVRLLIVAVPPYFIDAPIIVAHGFFQLAFGIVIVGIAAVYKATSANERPARALLAPLAASLASAVVAVSWWNSLVTVIARSLESVAPHVLPNLRPAGDVQGALVLLPVYQVALLTGFWIALGGGRSIPRFLGALGSLLASQVFLMVAVGEFETHSGIHVHALAIRAWAVVLPVVLSLLWTAREDTPASVAEIYREFWHDVGDNFPSLTGAPSTRYYFANETRLLTEHLPNLSGCALLKTDLWDEAKNTRIMQWAAQQGARVYGIDISPPIVREARRAFNGMPLEATLADVRGLPFADASFDAIYSMGTIEHFPESQLAVEEMARVLKPGGRLILGVPNLHDPFLRPLFVWLLQRFDGYGYGTERAFSRRSLRRMLERAGLDVVAETGILFIPGWLRMLDLWFHTRARPFTRLTAPLVAVFESLDRRFRGLRRHGYLIASVGTKPMTSADRTTTTGGRTER